MRWVIARRDLDPSPRFDSGPAGARAGYLPQELPLPRKGEVGGRSSTVIDSVLSSVPGRDQLESRLRETESELAQLPASNEKDQLELAQQLADLHAELDHFEERFG